MVLNVRPGAPGGAASFVGKATVDQYHQAEAEEVLDTVTKFLGHHNMLYTSSYQVGHAAEQILSAAKESKADLIVMGSRGRGTIGSLLLGSVAQSIMSASEVPVLVER